MRRPWSVSSKGLASLRCTARRGPRAKAKSGVWGGRRRECEGEGVTRWSGSTTKIIEVRFLVPNPFSKGKLLGVCEHGAAF